MKIMLIAFLVLFHCTSVAIPNLSLSDMLLIKQILKQFYIILKNVQSRYQFQEVNVLLTMAGQVRLKLKNNFSTNNLHFDYIFLWKKTTLINFCQGRWNWFLTQQKSGPRNC